MPSLRRLGFPCRCSSVAFWAAALTAMVLGRCWADEGAHVLSSKIQLDGQTGIDCSGVQDSTAAMQAAVDLSNGRKVILPANCRLRLHEIVVPPTGLTRVGAGSSSVLLKDRSVTGHPMLSASAAGGFLVLRDLVVDGGGLGDESGEPCSISFTAADFGGAASRLDVQNVEFRNGQFADIKIGTGSGDRARRQVSIRESRFLGGVSGRESFAPRYIDIKGTVDALVADNLFDFGRPVVASAETGRAGVVLYSDGAAGSADPIRITITGNRFDWVGRSQRDSTIGAIDVFSNGANVIVADNRVRRPYGRGITIRADTDAAVVSGNIVDGLLQGPMGLPCGGHQIGVLAAIHSRGGRNFVLSGNVVQGAACGTGIMFAGLTAQPVTSVGSFVIEGNVVDLTASDGLSRGISLLRAGHGIVSSNVITGGQSCIYGTDTVEGLTLEDNTCDRQRSSAIFIVGVHSGTLQHERGLWLLRGNLILAPNGRGIALYDGDSVLVTENIIDHAAQEAIELRDISGHARLAANQVSESGPVLLTRVRDAVQDAP